MNISKKALMSFIMALTSAIAMAQPYYHVMKRDGSKLTEKAIYDAKAYKIKVQWTIPRAKNIIGGKITIAYDCDIPKGTQRSFYFTKNGNVYYDKTQDRFFFEESQLDYPSTYSENHIGHFFWDKTLTDCTRPSATNWTWDYHYTPTETHFYFANPDNLPKLQKDLGNEKWGVLSYCEWWYIINELGQSGWTVDGKNCYLIDTSSTNKSLLRAIESKNGGKTMSKEDFEFYEAQGLVCLPAAGYRSSDRYIIYGGREGYYHACTPNRNWYENPWCFWFINNIAYGVIADESRNKARALRLVVLAD